MSDPNAVPDFAAITGRQKAVWATGDFNALALQVMPVSEGLLAVLDPGAGKRVLDIACGSGNAALVAARRNCDVVGIDFVPSLLERARQRAAADGCVVEFREADAQALPFPDASFDFIVSAFGVMFAPDQEKAAAELLRVCKPGGRVALATWMPDGFGGEFFRTVGKYAPPPPGLKPPVRWGTEAGVRELMGAGTSALTLERRTFTQRYRSMEQVMAIMTTHFGPVVRALSTQDAAGQLALKKDLEACFGKLNRATDGTLAITCDYALVLATRR